MLCFHGHFSIHGRDLIYNESSLIKYYKYLGALFWQAGTMEQLRHCLCALKKMMEVVWEQLRRTMQIKAFRLNKYENSGKVFEYFHLFKPYTCASCRNLKLHVNYGSGFKFLVCVAFHVLKCSILFAFSCLFDPALDFGKHWIYIY